MGRTIGLYHRHPDAALLDRPLARRTPASLYRKALWFKANPRSIEYMRASVAYRMARHYALVLEVKARQERGESLQQVQDDMTEHRFVVQKAFDAAQQASPERLEDALKLIRDYEWEVKSGQVDAELGFDVLLTRL